MAFRVDGNHGVTWEREVIEVFSNKHVNDVDQGEITQTTADFDDDDADLSKRRERQRTLDVRLHSRGHGSEDGGNQPDHNYCNTQCQGDFK